MGNEEAQVDSFRRQGKEDGLGTDRDYGRSKREMQRWVDVLTPLSTQSRHLPRIDGNKPVQRSTYKEKPDQNLGGLEIAELDGQADGRCRDSETI